MRHFNHHIGDYSAATQHLSFVEDAAYHRAMRLYYQTEKPLLSDVKGLARLLGARTKEEKEAVQTVLNEFFTLEADGWHQRRCDAEIERYREKVQKAAEAGRKGGRPRRTDKSLQNNDTGKADVSSPESERNPNQKPTTQPSTLNPQPVSKDPPEASPVEPAPEAAAADDGLTIPQFLRRSPDARAVQDEAMVAWNAAAERHGLKRIDFLTSTRRFRLDRIFAICGGIDGFRAALEHAPSQKFLRTADDGWQRWFNFDWLLDEDKFTRLMEGTYAERHRSDRPDERSTTAALAGLAEAGSR